MGDDATHLHRGAASTLVALHAFKNIILHSSYQNLDFDYINIAHNSLVRRFISYREEKLLCIWCYVLLGDTALADVEERNTVLLDDTG